MAQDSAFTGDIAELYERELVPMLFEEYAAETARRVAAARPRRVLEIACGTGAVTRALVRALSADVEIVATDLNPGMLERAAQVGTSRPVEWRQADALHLPFEDASFDVVVCQFGAMFFPDKPRAYSEARRVLRLGGTFLFAVWGRIEENEFGHVTEEAVATMFPHDPPRFLSRTPYGYFDRGAIDADLARGGFRGLDAYDTIAVQSRAATPRVVAIGFCHGCPLRNEIVERDATALDRAIEVASGALAARFGHGPLEARMQAHIVRAVS